MDLPPHNPTDLAPRDQHQIESKTHLTGFEAHLESDPAIFESEGEGAPPYRFRHSRCLQNSTTIVTNRWSAWLDALFTYSLPTLYLLLLKLTA